MMIYALVAMLVCILILAYVTSGQDLFNPWVIVTASFLNSSVLAMLNLEYWQYGFHEETCLVIITALIMFGIGSILASYAFPSIAAVHKENRRGTVFDIPSIYPLIIFLVSIVLAAIVFKEMYTMSVDYGNTAGIKGVLPTLRQHIEARQLSLPKLQIYSSIMVLPTAVFFLYVFFNNFFNDCFRKKDLLYLFPVISYLPHIILSTGRLDFLAITVMIIFMAGVLYQNRHGVSLKSNLHIVSFGVISLMLFFAVFLGVGSFTWKGVTSEHGPFRILSHYTGAQIPAFDVFLQNSYPEDEWIGSHTLIGPYGNLKSLGVDVPTTSMFMEFTHFANVDTNVYTSLRRYIQDYGYTGMAILVFLIGAIYTSFYRFVRSDRRRIYGFLIYVLLSWPLFLFGHDDLLLTGLVSTRTIYYMIIMGILYFGFRRYCKVL